MRLTHASVPQVVWEDGMHLSAHHFQLHRRHYEDTVARTFDALVPFGWGLTAIALDGDALRNGTLALREARGILPDGTSFDVPASDPTPAASTLGDRFLPTQQSHVVHIALPEWRGDSANLDGTTPTDAFQSHTAVPNTGRFVVATHVMADETVGGDPVEVKVALRRMQLVLDTEVTDGMVSMPVARIRRDREGQFVLDDSFIPPTVRVGASAGLVELLRRVLGMIEEKARNLAASGSNAPTAAGASGYAGNELATRWLLHTLKSAEAPLRHMLLTRLAHPEQLFLELSRVASALCTFSFGSEPRDLPPYDHAQPENAFHGLERRLREQLNVVVSSQVVAVPLLRNTGVRHVGLPAESGAAFLGTPLYVGAVADARAYEPGARWFIGVSASLERHELIERVQRLAKVCASKFVLALVQRAVHGLPLSHLPAPPATLAPRHDLTYFELTLDGPCALSLRESREIGVYLPDAVPDPYVEVFVLTPT